MVEGTLLCPLPVSTTEEEEPLGEVWLLASLPVLPGGGVLTADSAPAVVLLSTLLLSPPLEVCAADGRQGGMLREPFACTI